MSKLWIVIKMDLISSIGGKTTRNISKHEGGFISN